MLFYLYLCIVILMAVLVLRLLFSEKDWRTQVSFALLLIPLLLRMFLIK